MPVFLEHVLVMFTHFKFTHFNCLSLPTEESPKFFSTFKALCNLTLNYFSSLILFSYKLYQSGFCCTLLSLPVPPLYSQWSFCPYAAHGCLSVFKIYLGEFLNECFPDSHLLPVPKRVPSHTSLVTIFNFSKWVLSFL